MSVIVGLLLSLGWCCLTTGDLLNGIKNTAGVDATPSSDLDCQLFSLELGPSSRRHHRTACHLTETREVNAPNYDVRSADSGEGVRDEPPMPTYIPLSPIVSPSPEMSSITPGAGSHLWGLRNVHMLSPYGRTFVTHSRAVNTAMQFRPVLATVDQQRPPGSSHEASTAQPWNSQAHPGNAARFSPSETRAFTNAQKTELPGQGSVSGGRQYSCGLCKKRFKRRQDLMRHVRDVHGPPRQCPLCSYEWTRAYKIKAHLLNAHSNELCPVVSLGIRVLRGHDVVEFIDTHELLRGFETPE
ncbi:hypothetical protein EDB86DRAFT_2826658 [Lactarius hatsudake]|nr:hypothetical protein EDB86DRAFT_2826658 [Lactarius hatsudake]